MKKRYQACGDRLSDLLMLVCGSDYAEKRTVDEHSSIESVLTEFTSKDDSPDEGIIHSTDFDNQIQVKQNLSTRRVVDECCKRSCSHSTLLSYCG
nr:probable insulin-like peptide 5 [Onthophagus taurus]XP_022910668.1 probable insulin-like peptide 5 [Onthophagus taurus]